MSEGLGYGELLKRIFAPPQEDGPPYVHTFTFPDEDDNEVPA